MVEQEQPKPVRFDGIGDVPRANVAIDARVARALSEDELRPLYDLALLAADWSGHGSPRISPTAIAVAAEMMRQVARATGARPDFIAPLGNGGVQLEWDGETTEIQVEVHPDRTFSFLLTGAMHDERQHASLRETLEAVAIAIAH